MSTITKIIVGIVLVCIVAFAAAFVASRFLVSRLDGTGGVHRPALERYSAESGLSFMYPSSYTLSSRTNMLASSTWDSLLLVPTGSSAPQNGEEPPAISISTFDAGGQTLEEWVRADPRSGFQLDGRQLAKINLDGNPAVSYQHSGLYENDAVAVLHNGKIFLLEAPWMTAGDQIRGDFQKLVQTVHFEI